MNVAEIKRYLDVAQRALDLAREALDGNVRERKEIVKEPPVKEPKPSPVKGRQKHIQDLLEIDCWPEAVSQFLISEPTEKDQINRANMIFDTILNRSVEGQRLLDFGCGEGWLVREAQKRGFSSALGFDLQGSDRWAEFKGVQFTSDLNKLTPAHYHVIVLYDVLDHAKDPVEIMQKVRTLLVPGGVVYVRCHPWISKHGSHLYKIGLNKAFFHLFLTAEELKDLGYNPLWTRREIDPLPTYRSWFQSFRTVKERIQREPLSDFFLVPEFKKLLIDELKLSGERQVEFFKDMEISFLDAELA